MRSAGLPAVGEDVTLAELRDGAQLAEKLAGQEPLWTPEEAHRYHGLIVGAISQRRRSARPAGSRALRGLARVWSATVTETRGVRLWNAATAEAFAHPRGVGAPFFSINPPPYRAWGPRVVIPSGGDPHLTVASFGHDGAGVQVAFADPEVCPGFGHLTIRPVDMARGISAVNARRAALGWLRGTTRRRRCW